MKNYIFVVEGNHDIAYLFKILNMLGYDEIKSFNFLNENMKEFLPTNFPFRGTSLNIFNHVPYFFKMIDSQVMILNADGEKNILKKIDDELSRPMNIIENINHIVVFADGDLLNKDDKIRSILDLDYEDLEFEFVNKKDLIGVQPCVNVQNKRIPADFFILPNNNDIGRLENVILEGISVVNPELLLLAKEFIDKVDVSYKVKWNVDNSKYEKAVIGVVGNALIPSASNTTSICDKRTKWISEESKLLVEPVQLVYDFLNDIIVS